jgi:hypothetical protein
LGQKEQRQGCDCLPHRSRRCAAPPATTHDVSTTTLCAPVRQPTGVGHTAANQCYESDHRLRLSGGCGWAGSGFQSLPGKLGGAELPGRNSRLAARRDCGVEAPVFHLVHDSQEAYCPCGCLMRGRRQTHDLRSWRRYSYTQFRPGTVQARRVLHICYTAVGQRSSSLNILTRCQTIPRPRAGNAPFATYRRWAPRPRPLA